MSSLSPSLTALDLNNVSRILGELGGRLVSAALGDPMEAELLHSYGVGGFMDKPEERLCLNTFVSPACNARWHATSERSQAPASERAKLLDDSLKKLGSSKRLASLINRYYTQSLTERFQLSAPDHFWMWTSRMAWESGPFVFKTRNLIFEQVASRYLILPTSSVFQARLQPETVAVLVILACANQPKRKTGLFYRLKTHFLKRYQIEVESQAMLDVFQKLITLRSQWAGIWDQWLLYQAFHRWEPRAFNRAPKSLVASLESLPYFTTMAEKGGQETEKEPPSLWSDPEWQDSPAMKYLTNPFILP